MEFIVDQIPGYKSLSPEWQKTVKEKAISLFMWADWACGTRDPRDIIAQHTSYFAGEVVFMFVAFLTLIHAWRKGGRFLFLWIGIIIHSLNTELISYLLPDVDNFWHAQGMLMFFGRRLPTYVLFGVYLLFDYTSSIAVKRLRLPWWAEGPAVGLGAVLLDIPYDIMGVKLLWWTWHDTDPNIYDRMYWVPWNSYYFHASFACAFTWVLNGTRKLLVKDEYDWKLFFREFLCTFIAGMSAFWVGAAMFVPIYHLFHDMFQVPSECTSIFFLSFFALLVWIGDRNPKSTARPRGYRYWFDELALGVVIHYVFYMILVLVAEPESITSIGLHEPIGPCDQFTPVQTVSGLVLRKRKYLCPTRYDEAYFDFHCLPDQKAPKMQQGQPVEWYKICGRPFPNHMEYVFVIWAFCLFGMFIFYQWLARSGETPEPKVKVYKKKKE